MKLRRNRSRKEYIVLILTTFKAIDFDLKPIINKNCIFYLYFLYFFLSSFRFQYILAAATSIATKNNEDTLTYLNQGQSYEIKLKKIGDLSMYRDKILKVCKKYNNNKISLRICNKICWPGNSWLASWCGLIFVIVMCDMCCSCCLNTLVKR